MIVKKTNKKTLDKYAINQIKQFESESQDIESIIIAATFYSKARATTLAEFRFAAKFSEKKVHCSQVSNGDKTRFYQNNIERFFILILKIAKTKCNDWR